MKPFSSSDNICAQNLLTIVAHGNAIIAEILRLKDHVPNIFLLDTKDLQNKYNDNVFDFAYFKTSDLQDKKIANDLKLQEIDEEIKETHLELISRFYLAFESIFQYVVELNLFLEQLDENVYIQQSLETILYDVEGKQLLCESLYLYGAMLLICDLYIPGPVRERLLVAFYRYSTNQSQSHIDDVCKLLADTGFHNGKKPTDYPVHFFRRVSVHQQLIEAVLNRMRSEDIYNQLVMYPLAEHRSTALATQSTMLFVSLFFTPHIINEEITVMREIADKFFSDNWVIPIYMGVNISILEMWENFKAAKNAIANTCNSQNVKSICIKHETKVLNLTSKVQELLKEGTLTDEMVLDDLSKIISLIRESNVIIRWFMMHSTQSIFYESLKKNKVFREMVIKETNFKHVELLELLVSTAQLECKVREVLQKLINERNDNWAKNKKEAIDELESLADLFSGAKKLNKIKPNEHLKKWFETISKQISLVGDDISNKATKKLSQFIRALDEVEEYHGLKNSAIVVQSLSESKAFLKNALRTAALKDNYLVTLEVIADFSYAWLIIDHYTKYMQTSIKGNPIETGRLRTLFLKLASAMEIPLIRLNQSESEDMESVSEYYSSELVSYVKKVLQIIPQTVFDILAKIIDLQTWHIKEVPTRLDKDKLKEYAQLEQRFEVAKLTHSASTFMKGILEMKTTLVGVVRIDPAQLFEEGLKKELSHNLNLKLEQVVDCKNKKVGNQDLESRLQTLSDSMDGYKRSLEYIQDHINCHGLLLWNEEFAKIISTSISREIDRRGMVKVFSPSVNFIGSLAREIINAVDVRICKFSLQNLAWIEIKTSKEIVNLKTFSKLKQALDPVGLHGLDTIYGCMIKQLITNFITIIKNAKLNVSLAKRPGEEFFNVFDQTLSKNSKMFANLCEVLVLIGCLQTLRKFLSFQLNTSCKFECSHLESSLRTLNKALLTDIKNDLKNNRRPKASPEMLHNLEEYLLQAGLYNPYKKIYVHGCKEPSATDISLLAAAILVSQVGRLQISVQGELSTKRAGDNIDDHSLLVGLNTILTQFGYAKLEHFVEYLCDYLVRLHQAIVLRPSPNYQDAAIILKLLENYCFIFEFPFSFIENRLPLALLSIISNNESTK